MAAYDELLDGSGQDKFQQLYDKYDATMVALKSGTEGQYLVGDGIGSPPVFKTGTLDIEIGDWNMDSAGTKAVAHGMADYKKIRVLAITIRHDSDTVYSPLDYNTTGPTAIAGGLVSVDGTNINLSRASSGFYDNTGYDSTSYNRGFITIYYAD